MSEYQYYEWQTIGRQLSDREMNAVSKLSSHIEVTPIQAVVTYSWGDFKHEPLDVLERYFDAMLYATNWGTRQLAFRLPKPLIDRRYLEPYGIPEAVALIDKHDNLLLNIDLAEEEGDGWVEEEGRLSLLSPLREDILRGDNRLLYLAWLKGMALEGIGQAGNTREPPIPAGLHDLTTALEQFIDFFELNRFLVAAAAEISPPIEPLSDDLLKQQLSQLSREECERYLLQVLKGEPRVDLVLRGRLHQAGQTGGLGPRSGRRSFGEIYRRAREIEAETHHRKQKDAERKHILDLQDLARREEQAWQEVESLAEQKQTRTYDSAVEILARLRELAVYQGRVEEFQRRLDEFRSRYARRPALIGRFHQAGLDADLEP